MLERLIQYIEYKHLTIHKFEMSVGMANATISNGLKKGGSLNSSRLKVILDTYPDLSLDWLLTGKGNMLRRVPSSLLKNGNKTGRAPFFDVDFMGGFVEVFNDQTQVPDSYINCDALSNVQCWCRLSGHSMEPTLMDKELIALQSVNDWANDLIEGDIYAIVTNTDLRTVKRAYKGNDDSTLRLEPDNRQFPVMEVPKSSITHIFRVAGSIRKF
jgi:hypothetical protein